ncbi:hypothetical protein MtrunA17_Chr5g0403761 [Medicago truncatula]|uniref:Transmembrane protein n=1 Tax=Medicago truncatula TaxID=3880 RepID=G7KC85_MEDTR|nr:hypothetical protein MTR_5g019760 [Medicago truncatula]RHN54168.1 hypothetical protein MtrunA17_Chr5g0403761 [Medicago truncatula]
MSIFSSFLFLFYSLLLILVERANHHQANHRAGKHWSKTPPPNPSPVRTKQRERKEEQKRCNVQGRRGRARSTKEKSHRSTAGENLSAGKMVMVERERIPEKRRERIEQK